VFIAKKLLVIMFVVINSVYLCCMFEDPNIRFIVFLDTKVSNFLFIDNGHQPAYLTSPSADHGYPHIRTSSTAGQKPRGRAKV
jgi:hypothetical protein